MSYPLIASNNIAESITVFVIGPTWSNDQLKVLTPFLLTRPYVGFNPTTPQNEEGTLIDPPVSVPNAPKQSEADTAESHEKASMVRSSRASGSGVDRRNHGVCQGASRLQRGLCRDVFPIFGGPFVHGVTGVAKG